MTGIDKLTILYQQMSEFTAPVCASECKQYRDRPVRCCEAEYCNFARKFAKERYNIDLPQTGHPTLPFMGANGCTVPPHLRPICTLHACPISYDGRPEFPGDPERTQKYFQLRREILALAKAEKKIPEDRSGVWIIDY